MVRVWCVPVEKLDRQHLLGEHNELLIILNAIVKERVFIKEKRFPNFYKFLKQNGFKIGWRNHPQTNRFKNRLGQLVYRHNQQTNEMLRRGYKHNSPLPALCQITTYTYSDEEMKRDLETLKQRQKGVGTKKNPKIPPF